jgi:predicted RNase H-like nuclease
VDLIGIDGCRGGWVAALATERFSKLQFELVADIAPLLRSGAIVAIDIPIGLPESGPRACDLQARRVLGRGQASRIFPVPSRAAFAGHGYGECCELNRGASGRAVSMQTYAIIPKMREVDLVMSPELQTRVREAHPEVSFRLLNGRPLSDSKKTPAGLADRWRILDASGCPHVDPAAERLRLGRRCVAADDVLDAAACLLTARRIFLGQARVFGGGAVDARGLRMEIVA